MSARVLMCFWRHSKLKPCFPPTFLTSLNLTTHLEHKAFWKQACCLSCAEKRLKRDFLLTSDNLTLNLNLELNRGSVSAHFWISLNPGTESPCWSYPHKNNGKLVTNLSVLLLFLLFLPQWKRGVLLSLSDGQLTVGTSPSQGWFSLTLNHHSFRLKDIEQYTVSDFGI